MTDEPVIYQYNIFLLNGHQFGVASPKPFNEILSEAISNGYVLTQTHFYPMHAISFIASVRGQDHIPPNTEYLRSLN